MQGLNWPEPYSAHHITPKGPAATMLVQDKDFIIYII